MSSLGRTILICTLVLFIGISLFNSIGCGGTGGSGSTPTPTPVPSATPTATPQLSSFKGSYAFHLWGGPLAAGGGGSFFGMVGSFTSDGLGHISTGGSEEVYTVNSSNSLSTNQGLAITGGTYTISNTGVGQISLTAANPTFSAVLGIVLISPQHALITRLDNQAVAYGSADLQTTSAFASTAIASSSYVFDGLGVDAFNGTTIAHAGIFTTDNTGSIKSGGMQDINDGGALTANDPLAASPLPPPNVSTGRMIGSITDGGSVAFATTFYIVDSTHMKFIESLGGSTVAIGEIYKQSPISASTPNNAATGGYVFNLITVVAPSPFTLAGQAKFDGSAGNISSGVLDSNVGGTVHTNATLTAGIGGNTNSHYQIDTRGRGTLVLVAPAIGTKNFNFYPSIHGLAVIEMDTTAAGTANSNMFAQNAGSSGSFANTSIEGAYAASFLGGNTLPFTGVAQIIADGSGNFGSSSTFTVNNNGTIHSTLSGSGNYYGSSGIGSDIDPNTGRGTIVLQSTALPGTGKITGVIYVIGIPGSNFPGFLFMETDATQLSKGHAFSQGNF